MDFITRTDPSTLIILASVAGTFLTVLAFVLPYVRPDPLSVRLRAVSRRRQELRTRTQDGAAQRSRLRRARPGLLGTVADRLKLRQLFAGDELRARLLQANWRDANAVALFATARAAAPLLLLALAALVLYGGPQSPIRADLRPAALFAAVVAGVYLPNLLMQNAIQKRQQAFTLGFPDALDLLLICVETGLSMEAAFGRVAREIGDSYPELAEELELTTAELAYLPDRRVALENLSVRTGLPAVKAVCTTLIQADRYGTPLASALRIAAQENRDHRLALAEKKAASLPATLTVPMIVFFLPVLFMVILGPTVIQVMK
ncbi:MAG: type II secretion system F family protein [Rhodospirillaceae bacterium]